MGYKFQDIKLLPCPFCNGEGHICRTHWDFSLNEPYPWADYVVECKNCGAYGPVGNDEYTAKKEWNTRRLKWNF